MFGQVVDRLDKWLGPSFVLSYFLPWLIFAVANLTMIYCGFPHAKAVLDLYIQGNPADKVLALVVGTAAVGVAAYITAPLIPALTDILEGRTLPPYVAEQLTIKHAEELDDLEIQLAEMLATRESLRGIGNDIDGLKSAKVIGDEGRRNLGLDLIENAEKSIEELKTARQNNKIITATKFKEATKTLGEALRSNCSEPNLLVVSMDSSTAALDQKRTRLLQRLHSQLANQLMDYAINVADQKFAALRIKRNSMFARAQLAPTRLGNDAAALRSYCETRYKIDFDFFWPRLQVVFQSDARISAALSNAKVQLDFAVILFWLTVLFIMTWVIVLPLCTLSLTLFVITAGIGPIIARVWLGLVQASYFAYADLVRSAIDLKRRDLLAALSMKLPNNIDDERKLWNSLGRWLLIGSKDEIKFAEPAE